MSEQPDRRTGPEPHDGGPSPAPPPAALQGYPPEADPEPEDDTDPVAVAGEQTDPDRRLDVFPEDSGAEEPPG